MSIEDELYEITEATNDDGTVDVTIERWEKVGSDVEVYFTTPTRDEHFVTFDWPHRDTDAYRFVRLCNEAGLDLAHAMQLEGSVVRAEKKGDQYALCTPKETQSEEHKLLGSVFVALLGPPLILIGFSPLALIGYIIGIVIFGMQFSVIFLSILIYLTVICVFVASISD